VIRGTNAPRPALLLFAEFAIIVLCTPCLILAVHWVRLELHRARSRFRRPQPMELWRQDDALLYIESTDTTGVHLLAFDAATNLITRSQPSIGSGVRLGPKKGASWHHDTHAPIPYAVHGF
jgi:hypothetical protein